MSKKPDSKGNSSSTGSHWIVDLPTLDTRFQFVLKVLKGHVWVPTISTFKCILSKTRNRLNKKSTSPSLENCFRKWQVTGGSCLCVIAFSCFSSDIGSFFFIKQETVFAVMSQSWTICGIYPIFKAFNKKCLLYKWILPI